MVLLHVLAALRRRDRFRLTALHVEHGLQAAAAPWPQFCRRQCERLRVRLQVCAVTVNEQHDSGLEAAARRARHAAFAAQAADWIVLAHHLDDQAETILYRLLRGTGSRGMGAMRVSDRRRRLLRPMLSLRRQQIEQYARENALEWVEDPSNEATEFARNHLRNHVFPLLTRHFSDAAPALARAATHFARDADLLEQLAAIDWAHCGGEPLSAAALLALPPERILNLLRYLFVRRRLYAPTQAALEELLRQLRVMHSKARAHSWPLGDALLVLWRGHLLLESAPARVPPVAHDLPCPLPPTGFRLPWAGGYIKALPCVGSGIAAQRLEALCDEEETAVFGSRWAGAKMRLASHRPSRTLKNLFQENGVPAVWRDALPVLRHRQQAIWVARLGVAAQWRCAAGERGWQLDFYPPQG